MLRILLQRLKFKGNPAYIKVDPAGFVVPEKALLYPPAAKAFNQYLDWMAAERDLHPLINDCFRRTQEQVEVLKKKPNLAYKPGTSGHEFGISIDLSTALLRQEATKNGIKYSTIDFKADLLRFGWTPSPKEAWHFNFLEGRAGIQDWVSFKYGAAWDSADDLPAQDLQKALQQLGYYKENVDGQIGPRTIQAVQAFQKDYMLDIDGKVGPSTRKVLLIATAELSIVS